MINIIHSLFGATAFYLLYCIYFELTVGRSRRALAHSHGCKPIKNFPEWEPFLGLRAFVENRRAFKEHRFLSMVQDRYREMGVSTFGLKMLGLDVITTSEPENLKSIQALDFKSWSLGERRIRAFVDFLGPGIFSTDGAEWAHSREMLRPNFNRSQVGDLATFERHVGHLVEAVPRDGSTVDLQDLFFRLTMDSATEFLFGESTLCLAPGTNTVSSGRFADAFNRGQEEILERARWGRLGWLTTDYREMQRTTRTVHAFVDEFVDKAFERQRSGTTDPTRYIFADALLAQTSDRVQIRSELLNILLAGRDTTASLLNNVFFTLARRPDVADAVRAEIAPLGGQPPDYAQLKELKYLRAVLNETLRLLPVVPGNSRQALEDTVLPRGGGEDGLSPVFVKKGTVVNWNLWVMHQNPKYFGPDAEQFRPERWLGEKGLRPGWEYLPFNGGARICLGQQFALTEASYTTVRLLQVFKAIEPRDNRPWTEWITLTCTGLHGCKVAMTPA